MAFLKPIKGREWNFLVILLIIGLFSGCAALREQLVFQTDLAQIGCQAALKTCRFSM